jgi:hypothetical protein
MADIFTVCLKEDTGLIKVCVTAEGTNHKLCHYMNAAEEEAQTLSPGISVHAGIYIFPCSQVSIDTNGNSFTILKDQKTLCKTIRNSYEVTEQMIDIYLNR